MSSLGSPNPLLFGAAEDYEIDKSLRFGSDDNAYLNITPSSTTSRTTWTLSLWVKRTKLNATQGFFGTSGSDNNTLTEFYFASGNKLCWGAYSKEYWRTTRVFKDCSAWYHIVITCDTTNGTQADRQPVYVNGERITSFSTQNLTGDSTLFGVNRNVEHRIGERPGGSDNFDGYLSEIHFIDGTALDHTSFGETNTDTGQWVPKKYAGSYGTNGFYLEFKDNSGTTATTLGKDSSGNGNNWTPNNFSVTAGTGDDSVTDSPTNNYCVVNQNYGKQGSGSGESIPWVLKNGGLHIFSGYDYQWDNCVGTMAFPKTGKWYYEVTITDESTGGTYSYPSACWWGIESFMYDRNYGGPTKYAIHYGYQSDFYRVDDNGSHNDNPYGAAIANGSTTEMAFLLNWDDDEVNFLHTDSALGTRDFVIADKKDYVPSFASGTSSGGTDYHCNFGQKTLHSTIPAGYKTLCTQNLPEPAIKNPTEHVGAVLYTGDGAVDHDITGINFQPDLVVVKSRTQVANLGLIDVIRKDGSGYTTMLYPDLENEETMGGSYFDVGGGATPFLSNGFRVNNNNSGNKSGESYVGHCWKAGGAAVSDTSGGIDCQRSTNATAGFSIITYTGGGETSDVNVATGLSASLPLGLAIVKRYDDDSEWQVGHWGSQANNFAYHLEWDDNNSMSGSSPYFMSSQSATDGSKLHLAAGGVTNTAKFVAYVWQSIEGFSKFGHYVGNGQTNNEPYDSPIFIYLGFKPVIVWIKRTDSSDNWAIYDNLRSDSGGGNPIDKHIRSDNSQAEVDQASTGVNFYANGFTLDDNNGQVGASGGDYLYAAWAEAPFKYATAR